MVVAIVYNTTWYIYNFRRNLIASLQQAGHEVIAMSPADEYVPKLEALGVKHFPLPLAGQSKNLFTELRTMWALGSLIRKTKPDCVLSFTVKCNLYTALCRRIFNFYQVANISGLGEVFDTKNFLFTIVCALYRIGFKGKTWIFFQNQEDLELCLKLKLIPPHVCERLPGSGVDLSLFSPVERPASRSRTFLMFGRILPKKGYDLFLKSALHLKARYGDAVQFEVMGIPDKNRRESLELYNRICAAQDEGIITLRPKTDNVRPVLQAVDAVVLPSTYNEGVPRSILEAMACAKPIVTTDWKGCRETVIHGQNGFLIKPEDEESLTKALETIVLLEDAQLKQMGYQSRRLAMEKFDESVVLSAYLDRVSIAPMYA